MNNSTENEDENRQEVNKIENKEYVEAINDEDMVEEPEVDLHNDNNYET